MIRRIGSIFCIAALLCCLLTGATAAEESVTVSANLSGAAILIDGTFSGKVTDANEAVAVSAPAGSRISLELPGYTAESVNAGGNDLQFTLSPELYPAAYEGKVIELTVDGKKLTLDKALDKVGKDKKDNWYVISFAEGVTEATIKKEKAVRARGRYTIYGGPDGISMNSPINIYGVSDVRIINLDFSGLAGQTQLTFRAYEPFGKAAVVAENIYVLGCRFQEANELGIYQCVPYGCGGTDYGSKGTFTYRNINFCNNAITGILFNFAAAGDGDYNVIENYSVCANEITDGGVTFLTADAHSWYVYDAEGKKKSGDMKAGQIGFCEYNVIRNVLVSGNRIHNGYVNLQAANLGNQNNILEHVVVRNNVITNIAKTFGDEAAEEFVPALNSSRSFISPLNIFGAVIADCYGPEMELYGPYITPGLTHTDGNRVSDITVTDNILESGYAATLQIIGVEANIGEQCGKDNLTENIVLERNQIVAAGGVKICGYGAQGNSMHSGTCENNHLRNVTFRNNSVTRLNVDSVFNDTGILAAGQFLSMHGEYGDPENDFYPDYEGSAENIIIEDNEITNFTYGIVAAGAAGDYSRNMRLKNVSIRHNTVTNFNFYEYALLDTGIIAAGSALATAGDDYTPLASQNCTLENVTIEENSVSARIGIAAGGIVANKRIKHDSTGNVATNIRIEKNHCTIRPQQPEMADRGDQDHVSAGIVAADLVEYFDFLRMVYDAEPGIRGNKLQDFGISGNECDGFVPAEAYAGSPDQLDWIHEEGGRAWTQVGMVTLIADSVASDNP